VNTSHTVAHLATNDIGGGAAIAAYRLHKGLQRIGEEQEHYRLQSRMIVAQKFSDDPTVLAPATSSAKLRTRLAAQLDQFPRRFLTTPNKLLLSPAWIPAWMTSNPVERALALAPAVVNLHWVAGGMLPASALARLRGVPVVWTLHDMWAFCGAEHYITEAEEASGNERYKQGYTQQNRPDGESGFDLNRWTWQRKYRAVRALVNAASVNSSANSSVNSSANSPLLTVVGDSRWLAGCARESAMFRGCRVEAINYGLDTARFHPINKAAARAVLGIPADRTVILFGAINAAHDPRKGIDLLAEALHILRAAFSSQPSLSHSPSQSSDSPSANSPANPPADPLADPLAAFAAAVGSAEAVECLVFGSSAPPPAPPSVKGAADGTLDTGFRTTYLGSLTDEIALAVVYAAADVMIVPSRQEAFGQTALEALACGTPAVAFTVGGLPDSIEHERNGYLARPFDTHDLARGIAWVLADKERHARLAAHGREKVLRGFTLEAQARQYREIYQQMTENL
jgi:glycosyltransferase involved in cell wall biosynthesis